MSDEITTLSNGRYKTINLPISISNKVKHWGKDKRNARIIYLDIVDLIVVLPRRKTKIEQEIESTLMGLFKQDDR